MTKHAWLTTSVDIQTLVMRSAYVLFVAIYTLLATAAPRSTPESGSDVGVAGFPQ